MTQCMIKYDNELKQWPLTCNTPTSDYFKANVKSKYHIVILLVFLYSYFIFQPDTYSYYCETNEITAKKRLEKKYKVNWCMIEEKKITQTSNRNNFNS